MQILFLVMLFILGACFGSFLCCQARRLRLKSTRHKSLGSRSVCLSCKTQLKWYDNIPIISWLILRGKCRHCGKKIGLMELLSELGLALGFLLLGTTINITTAGIAEWGIFVVILLLTLSLGFLAIYDGAYGELPTSILLLSILLAAIVLGLREWVWLSEADFTMEFILDPLASVLILGGLYLLLYLISRGKWVGDGDWILGVAIGLALASPWLAIFTLFIANFLACIIMLPTMKSQKSHKIHLGPFLVIAFVIAYSLSDFIMNLIVI